MKVNFKAIAKATVVLIFFTILPFIGLRLLPAEFERAITLQTSMDIIGIITRVAIVGIVLTTLILLRGHIQKSTGKYLAVSTVWKGFWLFFVFFLLSAGYPENLGLAILGGESGPGVNIVVLDFRLFAALATLIVAVMIVRSVLQFQEAKATQGIANKTKEP